MIAGMPEHIYRQARFLISAASPKQLPDDCNAEVAFAGRSNAGKSSAINTITDIKGLAKTSKTPGRTRLLNYFELSDTQHLVDLPGYGYAAVSRSQQKEWYKLLDYYFRNRQALCGIILVMDSRHPLKESDRELLDYASHYQIPVHCLLTKSDKLKQNEKAKILKTVKQQLTDSYGELCSAQLFSSLKKTGVDEARQMLDQWLNV